MTVCRISELKEPDIKGLYVNTYGTMDPVFT
jgi:hypothetical protein